MILDLPKLTADLKASKETVNAGVKDVSDEGSCNFDSVLLAFDRLPGPDLRERIQEAVEEAGYSCHWIKERFTKGLLIDPGVMGMAGRRTHGMRLLESFLRKAGWNVQANYMTD